MSKFEAPLSTFVLTSHPNADSLSIAQVGGWQCVVKTEDFINETLAVYLPLDSMANEDHPLLFFLGGKRIKTVKLRGVLSQGLLLPYSKVVEYMKTTLGMSDASIEKVSVLGKDFKGILRIRRWEDSTKLSLGGDAETPNPLFHKYTDIENIKNFTNVIKEGELVHITEKAHGCFKSSSLVSMADGKKKTIGELVNSSYRGYVMGYKDDKIQPVKVLNTFINGKSNNWLKIKVNSNLCKGNWFRSITCTPNHKIYVPDLKDYVEAKNLKVGDKLLMKRTEIKPTPLEEQILYGKVLGDGYLKRVGGSWALTYCHSEKQEDYVNWTAKGLKNIMQGTTSYLTSGYGSKIIRRGTVPSFYIKEQFKDWYSDTNKKIVPDSAVDKIGPIGLAFWYMDDGSLSHHADQIDRCQFATCSFDLKSLENCCAILKKYNIDAHIRFTQNKKSNVKHGRLSLNEEDAHRLFLLIAPYIPTSMQYKLPEYYRGHTGWLPDITSLGYKPHWIPQEIISIEEISDQTWLKYDLETESSNFFVGDVLVHNSSSRVSLIDNKFMIGSRNIQLKIEAEKEPNSIWHYVYRSNNLKDKLELLSKITNSSHVGIYGEIVGKGVQDLHYNHNTPYLYVYDIVVNGHYVSPELCEEYCKELSLTHIPILFKGEFSQDLLQLRLGNSTLADHVREGIVIKPLVPRTDPDLGRVVLKVISEDYLMRKNPKDAKDT